MTCARTQGFLAQRGVGVAVTVNAKSRILNQQDALALLKGVDQIATADHHDIPITLLLQPGYFLGKIAMKQS